MTSEGTILTPRSSNSSEAANTNGTHGSNNAHPKSRGSSLGRSKVRDIVGSQYLSDRQREERMNKMKSINEVEALRNIFHSFFEKGI